MDHERIRTEVLAGRLRDINGTIEAKKVLFRILKVQQNMSLSPMKIEQCVEDMMAALSERLQHEATNLWNKICPDDIYNPCPLVDDIYDPCPLVDDFYNPCPLVDDTIHI